VILLDAGPDVQPDDRVFTAERSEQERERVELQQSIQSRHPVFWTHNPAHFVNDLEHPYVSVGREPFVWIRGRQVGGRSLLWGGLTLRFAAQQFRESEADGAGSRWPLSYDDLAPHYARVEEFMGVVGARDGLPQLPDGSCTPGPPLSEEELRLRDRIETVWPERRVVQCRGIGSVNPDCGAGDPRWKPTAVQHRVLPAAWRTGRLQIRPNCIVSALRVSESGDRVTSVTGVDRLTGRAFELRGQVIALCASTVESVRILLNSRCSAAPRGLANSSGCLGRFLMDHAATALVGRVPGKRPVAGLASGGPCGILIPRFRNCQDRDSPFVAGYGIWGNAGRTNWPDTQDSLWTLCSMLEVLPRERNNVSLDAVKVDAWGIPVARIDLEYCDNERLMREDAERCMREMIGGLGWSVEAAVRFQPGQFVHELGGARMGSDRRTSILNPRNQSWDVRNLFVLDGSCFVTSGWQNPALTIMALAVRGCRYIKDAVQKHEL
jgi:choline dehydrogenase-like flavoprotein